MGPGASSCSGLVDYGDLLSKLGFVTRESNVPHIAPGCRGHAGLTLCAESLRENGSTVEQLVGCGSMAETALLFIQAAEFSCCVAGVRLSTRSGAKCKLTKQSLVVPE
jgi:hypothetical protein